ncbi:Wadjet anti-phage system protein JetA family protein [Paraburkholderia sp. 32]|uniref:Wadjet anti-phage system protein JetA family protein n=1 Tax=Paraburkholderia sp. 32 TaxID=2991057 RepID=UPI003D2407BD
MANQFFVGKRDQFFRPLTWTTRECCAAVLRNLYDRVHGPNADYSEALTREIVVNEVFNVLSLPEVRKGMFAGRDMVSAEEERQYASELVRDLKEHGWLEDYKDPIDLKTTLRLTRSGKEFSEVFSNLDNSRAKTRQRNMRSAKKALAAFLQNRDPDELLDSYDFSSRVVQDLQDDIDYFRSLIQSLTREALEQKLAWGEFNEFIEKRFEKEYSVRLVADSAERHRGDIAHYLESVRALPDEDRLRVDSALLQRAGWLEAQVQGRSPMLWLCDRMDGMVEAACNLKLPMLRAEMGNYVKRFTSLLRQALSLDYGAKSPLGRTMQWLKDGASDERDRLLDVLADRLGTSEVRLPAAGLRWVPREIGVDRREVQPLQISEASRVEAAMRRAEAEAFAFSERQILEKLLPQLDGDRLTLDSLPLDSALDVMVALHAVSAARSTEGREFLLARKLPTVFETDYFIADNFEIQVQPADEQVQPKTGT